MDIRRTALDLLSPVDRSPASAVASASQASAGPDTLQKPVAVSQNGAALRDILSRYDVTQLSPRDFSDLLQQLHAAGAISDGDLKELGLIRLDLDQSNLDPDTPVNLVDFFQQKLQQQEGDLERLEKKSAPGAVVNRESALRDTLRQIDWLKKFSLLHSSRQYESLDTVA